MKLQLGELRSLMDGLPAVLQKDLPIKTAYWLGRAFKEIAREFEPFEEARKKLVEKYVKKYTKDEKDKNGKVTHKKGDFIVDGNRYVLTDEEAFQKEFTDLANQEVEIKLGLTKSVYEQILKEYANTGKKVYQENYFLDTKDFVFLKQKWVLRVRIENREKTKRPMSSKSW